MCLHAGGPHLDSGHAPGTPVGWWRVGEDIYDVLIVGAGAAGCAAAMNLPQGTRTLLVDRGRPSDGRCCGGLLAPDAQRAIARLGLGLPREVCVLPEPQAVHVHDLDSGHEQVYRRDYVNLDRARFDAWLLDVAAKRAEFRPHTRLVGLEVRADGVAARIASRGNEEEAVRVRVLIGADGAASRVRRTAFPHVPLAETMLAIQVRLAAAEPPPVHEVLFASGLTDFYAWAIPKPGSVLVGSAFGRPRGARERFEKILAWYRDTFSLDGEVLVRSARRLTRPRAKGDLFGGSGPVLLAGEAAGLVSPSSGEGLSFAIASGAAAGRAAREASPEVAYGGPFRRLARRVARKFIKARVIFSPAWRRWALSLPWCP